MISRGFRTSCKDGGTSNRSHYPTQSFLPQLHDHVLQLGPRTKDLGHVRTGEVLLSLVEGVEQLEVQVRRILTSTHSCSCGSHQ